MRDDHPHSYRSSVATRRLRASPSSTASITGPSSRALTQPRSHGWLEQFAHTHPASGCAPQDGKRCPAPRTGAEREPNFCTRAGALGQASALTLYGIWGTNGIGGDYRCRRGGLTSAGSDACAHRFDLCSGVGGRPRYTTASHYGDDGDTQPDHLHQQHQREGEKGRCVGDRPRRTGFLSTAPPLTHRPRRWWTGGRWYDSAGSLKGSYHPGRRMDAWR